MGKIAKTLGTIGLGLGLWYGSTGDGSRSPSDLLRNTSYHARYDANSYFSTPAEMARDYAEVAKEGNYLGLAGRTLTYGGIIGGLAGLVLAASGSKKKKEETK